MVVVVVVVDAVVVDLRKECAIARKAQAVLQGTVYSSSRVQA